MLVSNPSDEVRYIIGFSGQFSLHLALVIEIKPSRLIPSACPIFVHIDVATGNPRVFVRWLFAQWV